MSALRSEATVTTRVRSTLLLLGALASSAGALSAQADEAAVLEVVASFHAALASGDSATVADLLGEGATILESGGVESRLDYLGGHMRADMRYEQSVEREPASSSVFIEGDVAWAASTSHNTGESRGRPIDSNSAELMVLVRGPNGWRIHAIHWSSRSNQG